MASERIKGVLAIHEMLVKLFCLLHKLKIRIIPIWKPQNNSLMSLTDRISQMTGEFPKKSFRTIEFIFNTTFTLDVYANGLNWKLGKFFSKVAAPGLSVVDSHMQDWSQDVCHGCPPVKLVIDAYSSMQRCLSFSYLSTQSILDG